jgi:hypothetical protein
LSTTAFCGILYTHAGGKGYNDKGSGFFQAPSSGNRALFKPEEDEEASEKGKAEKKECNR